jgi:hypothetical protein
VNRPKNLLNRSNIPTIIKVHIRNYITIVVANIPSSTIQLIKVHIHNSEVY